MADTFWHKQTRDEPLFPDLLWSRPENRRHAGKLLIIGGNGYEFKSPANAYGDALEAGIGNAKVLLPDSMQKVVKDIFPEAEFAPSTPSGSLARTSLAQMLDLADWADAILLAGDFGRKSETAIVLESLLQNYSGQVALTRDTVNFFVDTPQPVLNRNDTLLIATLPQLQRIASGANYIPALTSEIDMLRLVDWLHDFSKQYGAHIILKHLDTLFVASGGQVSSTPATDGLGAWRIRAASSAITWWLQNPQKPFEAISTALV
jgi:NAD(P)H-hydrate repair Nnr-like enzyme with NAD(P)H-hydrate dehydratase domain